MPAVHVLTVASGLSLPVLDALLTRTEAVLHQHGAARVWIDPTAPGTRVLAEFPRTPERVGPASGAGAGASAAVSHAGSAPCFG